MQRRTISSSLAPLALAALLAGCSFGSSDDLTEPASKIADDAGKALAEEVGQAPDEIECGEDDIEVVEGDTVDCTLTVDGTTLPVTVTFTSVDGSDYTFDVEVGTEPVP